MKVTSSFSLVPSRVIADLSVHRKISTIYYRTMEYAYSTYPIRVFGSTFHIYDVIHTKEDCSTPYTRTRNITFPASGIDIFCSARILQ